MKSNCKNSNLYVSTLKKYVVACRYILPKKSPSTYKSLATSAIDKQHLVLQTGTLSDDPAILTPLVTAAPQCRIGAGVENTTIKRRIA